MLKNLRKKGKKKGFTLIELVIVLAVLAIIALIAIPNFTKVKENAVAQADEVNCDQVSNITKLAISEGIIIPAADADTEFTVKVGTGETLSRITIGGTIVYGDKPETGTYGAADLQQRFLDVEKPQKKSTNGYTVTINDAGRVIVIADSIS